MTSKNLFFKLCIHDFIKRIWSFAVFFVIMFFAFPVHILLAGQNYKENWGDISTYLPDISNYYKQTVFGFENVPMLIVLIGAAVLLAMSGFSYLNSRKKVDFIHSMPVKRETLFAAKYVIGLLNYVLALFFNIGIGLLIIVVRGEFTIGILQSAGCSIGLHIVYFLLFYSVAILAVVLVGNLVVSFLGILVFYFYQSLVIILTTLLKEYFFQNYYARYENIQGYDPISLLIHQVGEISKHIEYSDLGEIVSFHYGKSLTPMYISLGLTVAVVVATWFLFKKRPSESAGKALVFPISEPIIKVAILTPCVICGGLLMFSVSYSDNVGWYVFGAVISFILLALILEMIFRLDFKAALKHKISALAAGVLVIFCSLFFFLDLGNFDGRLPKEKDIISMGVSFEGIGMEHYIYGNGFECEEAKSSLEKVDLRGDVLKDGYKLAEYLVENYILEESLNKPRIIEDTLDKDGTGEQAETLNIGICYRLKNGQKIYRNYTVECTEQLVAFANNVYVSADYKKEVFPIFEDNFNYDRIYFSTLLDGEQVRIIKAEREKFIEIYKEDVKNLTFAQTLNESPLLTFGFVHTRFRKETGFDYPVFDSFENTKAYLQELGASTEIDFDKLTIYNMTVVSNYGDGNYMEETYKDRQQQIEILENCRNQNSFGWNSFGYLAERYEVVVEYDYGNGNGSAILYLEKVPDFIKRDFEG